MGKGRQRLQEKDESKIYCARTSEVFQKYGGATLIFPAMFLTLQLLIVGLNMVLCSDKVIYTFTEFPYKETNKNEVMFREIEAACEGGCSGKKGISKILCIRQCVSPSCYRDLYQSDQLEEGEVDVRLNSFKGCFIQRYNRSRP